MNIELQLREAMQKDARALRVYARQQGLGGGSKADLWNVGAESAPKEKKRRRGTPPGAERGSYKTERWTPETVARLRVLFNHGSRSFTRIAALLGDGMTRAAVAGKCRTLGLRRGPRR